MKGMNLDIMNSLISIIMYIYPVLCVFVPCIIYQVFLYRKGTKYEKIIKGNLVWRYILIFYIYMVMDVVGMGSIWEIGKYESIIRVEEIKLIPFQSEGFLTYILNIIMLMPLGFLLPLIWKKYRTILKTIIAGFFFSLSIELGQLFNRRSTEIDDVLMNVLGTILGFSIWLIFNKLFKSKPKDINVLKDEPLVYLVLSVLGTFLLYNWRWLLTFAQ
ncbi:Glycopeptide antibiotics resistance protein [Faecalicatena contorta]|uniref:Glycopeptide antibiotics resistance protein n=2 Tax=Faecalicatena contorta TaxID=39482 RepID=A0A316A294_9FIRM|nr:glycopeptide antibiotics resistance protein [Faecalicatena contorta]SUQ13269.1 Glycopeptide antibiotics resistance protein [Faecalicatena contorta]